MTDALRVKGLRKSYGKKEVLRGIDLCVRKGDVFALLGVNGAGKTTTLECIEGLRKYDSGSISVDGSIGIQLQSASLPAHIKDMYNSSGTTRRAAWNGQASASVLNHDKTANLVINLRGCGYMEVINEQEKREKEKSI